MLQLSRATRLVTRCFIRTIPATSANPPHTEGRLTHGRARLGQNRASASTLARDVRGGPGQWDDRGASPAQRLLSVLSRRSAGPRSRSIKSVSSLNQVRSTIMQYTIGVCSGGSGCARAYASKPFARLRTHGAICKPSPALCCLVHCKAGLGGLCARIACACESASAG